MKDTILITYGDAFSRIADDISWTNTDFFEHLEPRLPGFNLVTESSGPVYPGIYIEGDNKDHEPLIWVRFDNPLGDRLLRQGSRKEYKTSKIILYRRDPLLGVRYVHQFIGERRIPKSQIIAEKEKKNDTHREKGHSLIFSPCEPEDLLKAIQRELDDSPKGIYILLAPPGYGKSTITKSLYWMGASILQKRSTRPRRIGETDRETRFISEEGFRFLSEKRKLMLAHNYAGFQYALSRDEVEEAISSPGAFIYPTTDPESAFAFRDMLPDNVKVIMLSPPLDFAGFGLEQRVQVEPRNPTLTIEDEIKRAIQQKEDTERRLAVIEQQARYFRTLEADTDLVIRSSDLQEIIDRTMGFMYA